MIPQARGDQKNSAVFTEVFARAAFLRTPGGKLGSDAANPFGGDAAALTIGAGTAFIGGGCCVHLSLELVPATPTSLGLVAVFVDDAEGTVMAWGKLQQPGIGYQIKEGIITTKPGADLRVAVINMTARVRWCEVFSC